MTPHTRRLLLSAFLGMIAFSGCKGEQNSNTDPAPTIQDAQTEAPAQETAQSPTQPMPPAAEPAPAQVQANPAVPEPSQSQIPENSPVPQPPATNDTIQMQEPQTNTKKPTDDDDPIPPELRAQEDKDCTEILFPGHQRKHNNLRDSWAQDLITSGKNLNGKVIVHTPPDDRDGIRHYKDLSPRKLIVPKDKIVLATPIFQFGNVDEVKMMLEAGADVNALDSNGQTILFYIGPDTLPWDDDTVEAFQLLKKYGININKKDNAGQTALSLAIPEMLKNTFGEYEDGILSGDDFDDKVGSSDITSFRIYDSYIRELLKAGAEVKGGKAKREALLKMKPDRFVPELIKVGMSINAKDIDGYTPLHKLVIHKNHAIGGDNHGTYLEPKPDIPVRHLETELYDPIKVLLDAGANPNIQDNDGRTPLFYAQNPHVAQALINAKASTRIQDKEGKTPLHFAVLYNNSILEEILKSCPDVSIRDNDGKLAEDYAVSDAQKASIRNACPGTKKSR